MVFKFKMSVHFMSNPCTRYPCTSPFVKVGKVHLLRTRSGSNSCTNHLALIGKSLPDHFTFVPDIKVPFGGSHTRVFQVGNLRIQRQFMFGRSEEHTSELQSRGHLVCRLLLEK